MASSKRYTASLRYVKEAAYLHSLPEPNIDLNYDDSCIVDGANARATAEAGARVEFSPLIPVRRREKLWQRKRREGKERARRRRDPRYASAEQASLPTIREEDDENPFGSDYMKFESAFSDIPQQERQQRSNGSKELKIKNGEHPSSDAQFMTTRTETSVQHQRVPAEPAFANRKGFRRNTTTNTRAAYNNAETSGARSLPELRERHDRLQSTVNKARMNIEIRKRTIALQQQQERERREAEEMRVVNTKMDCLQMADDSFAPGET